MSETYPRKNLCETLFAGHISLQRRIWLQRYKIISNYAKEKLRILRFDMFCIWKFLGCSLVHPWSFIAKLQSSYKEVES